MEESLKIKLNTLNSLIPTKMPYVLGQVNEAVKIAKDQDNFERNLDIAIEIAEQLAHFYKDDMLMYNYKPLIVALLLDAKDDADLSAFDTIGHEIPIALAMVKQFMKMYATQTKFYAQEFGKYLKLPDVAVVMLANLRADVKENKNLINISYILLTNNNLVTEVVNEIRVFYFRLKEEINEKQF